MKITYFDGVFAPMKYLNEMLKDYKDGYPNPRTEEYYETLKKIRDIQNSGQVPHDEYYQIVGGSVERGYYLANIHYYLYWEECSEYERTDAYKDKLNKRIIYFLKHADREALYEKDWFVLNFPNIYIYFLKSFYGSNPDNETFSDYISLHGNNEEKEILSLVNDLVG